MEKTYRLIETYIIRRVSLAFKDDSITLINRLFREHIHKHLSKLILAMFCMFIISITTALNAWLMQPVLDEIFFKKESSMLLLIPMAVLVNSVIKGVASFYQSSTMKIVGQRIVNDIQIRLYSHLVHSDMSLFHKHHSGKLISRFTNDINTMRRSVSDALTGLACELVTLIGLIGVMIYQSLNLAVISLIAIPIAFLPILRLGRNMRKISRGMQEEIGNFAARLDETFQNITVIKSYCREQYEIDRAEKATQNILTIYKKSSIIDSLSSPIMETIGGIAVALVIWYGGMEVIEGVTTPGAFFSFVTALLMAYKPLKSISQLNTSLQEGLAACKRVFNMLDEKPSIIESHEDFENSNQVFEDSISNSKYSNIKESEQKVSNITNILKADTIRKKSASFSAKNDIIFHNIHFSYKDDSPILVDLNMTIHKGQTVALVGGSGVGKSTIIQLIQRFYDPNDGVITIGEVNIQSVPLTKLRSSIGFVSQDVTLFDDTIEENIRYGYLDATKEEIKKAAIAAAAHDFIDNMPQGYDTHIGQNGAKLSGGQRQRIAIARAMLKNAPILLLDEATSSLDAISEQQVQKALESLKKGRTTIVIAHRLSTIESADVIYLISNGRVIEYGSHDFLLNSNGEYTKLYKEYKQQNSC